MRISHFFIDRPIFAAVISIVFVAPFFGYAASALSNNWVHLSLGQRGPAFIGPMAHLIAYIVIAVHPPYPVVVIFFVLAGFGNGIEDAAWNSFLGNLATSTRNTLRFISIRVISGVARGARGATRRGE